MWRPNISSHIKLEYNDSDKLGNNFDWNIGFDIYYGLTNTYDRYSISHTKYPKKHGRYIFKVRPLWLVNNRITSSKTRRKINQLS